LHLGRHAVGERERRRRLRYSMMRGSVIVFRTRSGGTPPLRAISTPQCMWSSSRIEWASGLMLNMQPKSSTAWCQRQSRGDQSGPCASTGIDPTVFVGVSFGTVWAKRSLWEQPSHTPPLRILASSSALARRPEDAQAAIARLRQLEPAFRISDLRDRTHLHRPQDLATFADGLRKAGLPE
jgi:hypothetical protein